MSLDFTDLTVKASSSSINGLTARHGAISCTDSGPSFASFESKEAELVHPLLKIELEENKLFQNLLQDLLADEDSEES